MRIFKKNVLWYIVGTSFFFLLHYGDIAGTFLLSSTMWYIVAFLCPLRVQYQFLFLCRSHNVCAAQKYATFLFTLQYASFGQKVVKWNTMSISRSIIHILSSLFFLQKINLRCTHPRISADRN